MDILHVRVFFTSFSSFCFMRFLERVIIENKFWLRDLPEAKGKDVLQHNINIILHVNKVHNFLREMAISLRVFFITFSLFPNCFS